ELTERVDRQVARMARYYTDLRAEAAGQADRARARGGDTAPSASRLEALQREEAIRTAELRRKAALRVNLRLTNLLLVHQPKLSVEGTVSGPRTPVARLDLVWDPLTDS